MNESRNITGPSTRDELENHSNAVSTASDPSSDNKRKVKLPQQSTTKKHGTFAKKVDIFFRIGFTNRRAEIASSGVAGVFRSTESSIDQSITTSVSKKVSDESLEGLSRLLAKCRISSPNLRTLRWPNNPNEYEIGKEIGYGATALVNEGFCKTNGAQCAIKRINLERLSYSLEEIRTEVRAMAVCRHENIITLYTTFVTSNELYIIMRLHSRGSILSIIKDRMKSKTCTGGLFEEEFIASVLKQTLQGLEYFHKNGFIHRDIKSGNILMCEDGLVQIADFGVSASLPTEPSNNRRRNSFVGTPCWMAPEVMQQTGYDVKADIWSVGITAIEIATGKVPFQELPPVQIMMMTLQNSSPTLGTVSNGDNNFEVFSALFNRFVDSCLQKDTTKRSSATDLLHHTFIKKARNKEYLAQYVHTLKRGETKPSKEPPQSSAPVESSYDWDYPTINALENMRHTNRSVPLRLKIRNNAGELEKIDFTFYVGVDTCEGLAHEMAESKIIKMEYADDVALGIRKIIDETDTPLIRFELKNYMNYLACLQHNKNEVDVDLLIGYGQIEIRPSVLERAMFQIGD